VPTSLFFSPDGEWIGFYDIMDETLKKVPVGGGPAVAIGRTNQPRFGASWGEDDTIIFGGDRGRIWRILARGGEPELLFNLEEGETAHRWPEILPGGKAVLFTALTTDGSTEKADLAVLSLETGERKTVLQGGSQGRYAPTGHLVYGVSGTLRAVRFDLDRLEVEGDPVPVPVSVLTKVTGTTCLAFSKNGTLAYLPADIQTRRTLVWVDREGREEVLTAQKEFFRHPRVSPGGRRIAVELRSEDEDIWIYDTIEKSFSRLTFDPARDAYPVWAPDGRRVFFESRRGTTSQLFWKASDGTGQAVPVEIGGPPAFTDNTISSSRYIRPQSFAPDGKSLVLLTRADSIDIALLSLEGGSILEALLDAPFDEKWPVVSPDGRFMAYALNESGKEEIYVRPFPEVNGGKWQISTGGNNWPFWSPDGRELFFWSFSEQAIVAVKIRTDPAFSAGNAEILFRGPYLNGNGRQFDISPDGERFLMVRLGREPGSAEIHVVVNWFDELKRLVPNDD
jgi:serine/threonine-protein kinase